MCNAESVVEVENVGLQLAGKENQKRKSIEMTQKIKRIYYHAINYRIWSCSNIPRTKGNSRSKTSVATFFSIGEVLDLKKNPLV